MVAQQPHIRGNPQIFNEVVENNVIENFRELPLNPPHPRSPNIEPNNLLTKNLPT